MVSGSGMHVGSVRVSAGVEAEDLGVNIICLQVHQPGYRRPDPLPSTSYKRQSMLPPTCACIHAVWFT